MYTLVTHVLWIRTLGHRDVKFPTQVFTQLASHAAGIQSLASGYRIHALAH